MVQNTHNDQSFEQLMSPFSELRPRIESQAGPIGARVFELQRQVETDHLTGLYNRQGFDRLLEERLSIIPDNEELPNIAVAYMDLDFFKNVNDKKGHHRGDFTLRYFADIVGKEIKAREVDGEVLARIGGDEFAVILNTVNKNDDTNRNPYLEPEEILNGFISRVRAKVAELAKEIKVPELGVSIGVVKFRDIGHRDETVEQFMIRADEAMYKNKHSMAITTSII